MSVSITNIFQIKAKVVLECLRLVWNKKGLGKWNWRVIMLCLLLESKIHKYPKNK
ncbi:hypothetical protein Goari_019978 [Gossypium aridum]|uniref:Uncharacterized protein n=3 Tax=Gossypium TaxID=3633 RepID=A0A7J8WUC6_GOSAI|nr:hypothetical protein [Gossypium aridum]